MVVDNRIAAGAFIGDGVELGRDVSVGPGAVVLGPTVIGDRVWIGSGAMIGGPPEISSLRQNTAWTGDLEHAGVVIGSDSVIRERVVIHQGSHRATTVGRANWILNGAYLAHDVQLGEDVTVSAGVSVGGHVSVGDRVNIGMNAVIHQRRIIGAGTMIGMGTPVTKDIPPFAKAFGTPPRLHGLNTVGLERMGASRELIDAISHAYDEGDFALQSERVRAALGALEAHVEWWNSHDNLKPMSGARMSGGGE